MSKQTEEEKNNAFKAIQALDRAAKEKTKENIIDFLEHCHKHMYVIPPENFSEATSEIRKERGNGFYIAIETLKKFNI